MGGARPGPFGSSTRVTADVTVMAHIGVRNQPKCAIMFLTAVRPWILPHLQYEWLFGPSGAGVLHFTLDENSWSLNINWLASSSVVWAPFPRVRAPLCCHGYYQPCPHKGGCEKKRKKRPRAHEQNHAWGIFAGLRFHVAVDNSGAVYNCARLLCHVLVSIIKLTCLRALTARPVLTLRQNHMLDPARVPTLLTKRVRTPEKNSHRKQGVQLIISPSARRCLVCFWAL